MFRFCLETEQKKELKPAFVFIKPLLGTLTLGK